jgi:hypothetical protein
MSIHQVWSICWKHAEDQHLYNPLIDAMFKLLDEMGSMARSHNPFYEIRQIHKRKASFSAMKT